MAVFYALPALSQGLRIQRSPGSDPTFAVFPRLPLAGTFNVDGEILDEPYDGAPINIGLADIYAQAVDLYAGALPPDAILRQSTISYGGGAFFLATATTTMSRPAILCVRLWPSRSSTGISPLS